MKKLLLLLTAVALGATSNMSAAILAGFDTDGLAQLTASAPDSLAAAALETGIESALMVRGAGAPKAGLQNTFAGQGWNLVDMAAALADNQYLSVTITPSAGFEMSLTDISFNWSQVNDTNTPYITLGVFASPSGFTASDVITTVTIDDLGSAGAGSGSISLVGAGFQNISTPVEFRVYGWGNAGAFAQGGFGLSNTGSGGPVDFVINGIVAVPEPSTYAVMASLIVVGVTMLRRKRK